MARDIQNCAAHSMFSPQIASPAKIYVNYGLIFLYAKCLIGQCFACMCVGKAVFNPAYAAKQGQIAGYGSTTCSSDFRFYQYIRYNLVNQLRISLVNERM